MCMVYDKRATANLKRRLARNGGKLTMWCVMHREAGGLKTPWRDVPICGPGWLKSDRPSVAFDSGEGDKLPGRLHASVVCVRGKHVVRTKAAAHRYAAVIWGDDLVVVPVQVQAKDCVAAGTCATYSGMTMVSGPFPSAVFTKVFLKKADYERALRGESA